MCEVGETVIYIQYTMTIIIQVTGILYGRYAMNINYYCLVSMNWVSYLHLRFIFTLLLESWYAGTTSITSIILYYMFT